MNNSVLIVDDEQGSLTLLRIMLERGGFDVREARNAHEALELLDNDSILTPELIILDIMMPGMDGIELCQELRQRGDTKGVPILMLTARDDLDTFDKAKEAGANDFLVKPILYNDIVEKVREFLNPVD